MRVFVLVLPMALLMSSSDARVAAEEQRLGPLAFLAGSCWTGEFPDGQATDTHCLEWVYDGRFLRDTHVVHGRKMPYEGETLYAWDPVAQTIVFTYWASDGTYSSGPVRQEGNALVIPERHRSARGVRELQNVLERVDDESYRIIVREQRDGSWHELWRMQLRRNGPAKALRP